MTDATPSAPEGETVDDDLSVSPTATADEHSTDARSTAVLAVLGGMDADHIADRYGINRGVLDRWVATFVEAGRAGLATGGSGESDLHRDRYLGLVAHELRSPLTMIRGWAELVRDGAAERPEMLQRAVAGILTQSDRLERLAEDALDATGVALGRLDLSLRPTSLADTVSTIVSARSLHMPGLDIQQDSEVNIDVDRFGQIIDNLLENARRHSGVSAPQITVGRRGVFAEVTVSSFGAPIEPELGRRLFEPFERGSTTGDGVGLGLYVCRSLVVAHGGQIGLRVDDEGNHFWVRLPLIDVDPPVI